MFWSLHDTPLNFWSTFLLYNLKRPQLSVVSLDHGFIPLLTNHSLCIKDGVCWVYSNLASTIAGQLLVLILACPTLVLVFSNMEKLKSLPLIMETGIRLVMLHLLKLRGLSETLSKVMPHPSLVTWACRWLDQSCDVCYYQVLEQSFDWKVFLAVINVASAK